MGPKCQKSEVKNNLVWYNLTLWEALQTIKDYCFFWPWVRLNLNKNNFNFLSTRYWRFFNLVCEIWIVWRWMISFHKRQTFLRSQFQFMFITRNDVLETSVGFDCMKCLMMYCTHQFFSTFSMWVQICVRTQKTVKKTKNSFCSNDVMLQSRIRGLASSLVCSANKRIRQQ